MRWLIVLALLTLAVRIPGLGLGLWFDEIQLKTEILKAPLGDVVSEFRSDNNHPFYSLLSWFSTRLFGDHNTALRLPALLFGVLSVVATVRLGERLARRRAGYLAGCLLLFSYHHVWFSQNARGYTALLFFALTATNGYLDVRDRGGRRDLIQYALALALGTYAHLTGVYVAVAHAILTFFCKRESPILRNSGKRIFAGIALGGAISLLLHAPLLQPMAEFFLGWHEDGRVAGSWRTVAWLFSAAGATLHLGPELTFVFLIVGALAGLFSLRFLRRTDAALPLLFLLPALLLLAVSLLLGRNLWPRFFFASAGFGALWFVIVMEDLALLFSQRKSRTIAAIAITAIFLGFLFVLARPLPMAWRLPKQDFEGARAFIMKTAGPEDQILTAGLAIQPYAWLHGSEFTPVQTLQELEERVLEPGRVFVLSTLPEFLKDKNPPLFQRIVESQKVAEFHGSLGDGAVVVYEVLPR